MPNDKGTPGQRLARIFFEKWGRRLADDNQWFADLPSHSAVQELEEMIDAAVQEARNDGIRSVEELERKIRGSKPGP